jgi:predicted GIY-YIG superfamily endonuclease
MSCKIVDEVSMSRSKVYTLHFWPKLEHAGHYTGVSDKLPARLVDHVLGRGARITQVQRERGGSWVVGRVEPGGRDRERQLKDQHNAALHCDVCHSLRDVGKGRLTKEEALAQSGWDRASEYERGLLLEIFGMEKPPVTVPSAAKPFVPAPRPQPVTEIDPALDAVVDALVDAWNSPKAEASADAPGLEAEAG